MHLLLEKPPAAILGRLRPMADGVRRGGRGLPGRLPVTSARTPCRRSGNCSPGAIGDVGHRRGRGVGPGRGYFRRAPWAGRRQLDGADVIDGALTNPLAHAVATALALGGGPRAEDVAASRPNCCHANDIEADDTSCVRIGTARRAPVTVAATLCAERAARAVRPAARRPAGASPSGTSRTASCCSAGATAPRSTSTAAPTCWRTWSTTSPRRRPAGAAGRDRCLHAGRRGDAHGSGPGPLPPAAWAPRPRRETARARGPRRRRTRRRRRRHPQPLLRAGRALGTAQTR